MGHKESYCDENKGFRVSSVVFHIGGLTLCENSGTMV